MRTSTLIAEAGGADAHRVFKPETGMLSQVLVFLPNLVYVQLVHKEDVGQIVEGVGDRPKYPHGEWQG
ncbi:MAG TPA: hypothetical protein ACFE0H_03125 [Elainellaceae cyanobacterium]